jgi:hypothetical protein
MLGRRSPRRVPFATRPRTLVVVEPVPPRAEPAAPGQTRVAACSMTPAGFGRSSRSPLSRVAPKNSTPRRNTSL